MAGEQTKSRRAKGTAKRPARTMERYAGSRDTRGPIKQAATDVESGLVDTDRRGKASQVAKRARH